MYPCTLSYRSTRALVLAATNRPNEALALLDYANYDASEPYDRSHREGGRAFALRQLSREIEAQQAVAKCLSLDKQHKGLLEKLGLTSPQPA
jgi:predicted RNA polymerase sigma factor